MTIGLHREWWYNRYHYLRCHISYVYLKHTWKRFFAIIFKKHFFGEKLCFYFEYFFYRKKYFEDPCIRDLPTVNFLRLYEKKCFFPVWRLIDHRLVRVGVAEAKESGGTAVNKNRGLIFFEQCHQCSCPPLWRVATLFSYCSISLDWT